MELLNEEQIRKLEEIKNSYNEELKQLKMELNKVTDEYEKHKEEIKDAKRKIFQNKNETFMTKVKYSKKIEEQRDEKSKLKKEENLIINKLKTRIPRLEFCTNNMSSRAMSLRSKMKEINEEKIQEQSKMQSLKTTLDEYLTDLDKLIKNKLTYKPEFYHGWINHRAK
ncbi:uncharacterized protein LOC111615929 [Centruroides sculpturatus]|uniref:uncharacterized protein LOC111615929 n=1 Tax=Centruroides sculpturatus TaxID=218467 RepID=UPI000C6E97DB|nr:uncharacterized protein LOC111615929 [Centruroides sculpturatus]